MPELIAAKLCLKSYDEAVPKEPSSPGAVQLREIEVGLEEVTLRLEMAAGGVLSMYVAEVVAVTTFEIAEQFADSSQALMAKS